MTDIISSSSLSFESILADQKSYVDSVTDDTAWKDFYDGGAGKTILRLNAGLGSFIAFHALTNRREGYLQYAKLRTSVYEKASMLGYPINRATCQRLKLNVVTGSPTYDVSRFSPIATIGDSSVSPLESETITDTVTCVVGDWVEYSETASETKDFYFIKIEDSIDNNLVELTVNDSGVTLVKAAEELSSDNAFIRTYSFGIMIFFGDGVTGKRISQGDVIKVTYVSPGTDEFTQLNDISMIVGDLSSAEITQVSTSEDSLDKLKVVAPGYYTTRRRLVTLSDFKFLTLSYEGIISANAKRVTGQCCSINVCALTDKYGALTTSQKTLLLSYLDEFKLSGNTLTIIDPSPVTVDVSLVAVVSTSADTTSIRSSIVSYFEDQQYVLGGKFSVSGLVSSSIDGLLRLYYKYPIIDKSADYNQFFVINSVTINFVTNKNYVGSNGTDTTLGYT